MKEKEKKLPTWIKILLFCIYTPAIAGLIFLATYNDLFVGLFGMALTVIFLPIATITTLIVILIKFTQWLLKEPPK